MKKNRVLVTGGTKSDVAPIATFLINVRKTNYHLFDKVVVFHDGISKKDQRLMQQILDVEFVLYKPTFGSKNGMIVNYFSPMLFCKYECLRLLKEYHQVIWSDYDVLFMNSLDEIADVEENCYISATTAPNVILRHKVCNVDERYDEYNLDAAAICAALMVFSDKLPDYEKLYEWCCRKTEELDNTLYYPEEAILSLMIQEFGLKFKMLDTTIYAIHPRNAKGNEQIIHAYGVPKFWNGLYNEQWMQNYSEWLEMGGTRYRDTLKKINYFLKLIKSKLTGVKNPEKK